MADLVKTHFLVRISLPKSEKMKSRNLAVKNHGGLRNWNSNIRQALADSCLIWQQSDLTAVRPDCSQTWHLSNCQNLENFIFFCILPSLLHTAKQCVFQGKIIITWAKMLVFKAKTQALKYGKYKPKIQGRKFWANCLFS